MVGRVSERASVYVYVCTRVCVPRVRACKILKCVCYAHVLYTCLQTCEVVKRMVNPAPRTDASELKIIVAAPSPTMVASGVFVPT